VTGKYYSYCVRILCGKIEEEMNVGAFCFETKLVHISLIHGDFSVNAEWLKCTKKDLLLCALHQK
jgi:hypothetical protein